MIPLFEHYPSLEEKLPYVPLGKLPTPVEQLNQLGEDIGGDHLYIKRDDLSGKLYGGNKVRKLEFLLGHTLRAKASFLSIRAFIIRRRKTSKSIFTRIHGCNKHEGRGEGYRHGRA